jgi:hypothetical protein
MSTPYSTALTSKRRWRGSTSTGCSRGLTSMLLNRVDINRLLDRVDLDAVMDRIDVERLVQRAGIPDTVAESTGSVAETALDMLRRGAGRGARRTSPTRTSW